MVRAIQIMLEIKKKNLDRREWYKDTDRDFDCRYYKDDFFEGGIGLITFTGLEVPDEVDSPSGHICIADKGYQWLELVPKDVNYALTSMFKEGRLFQLYYDITLKNEVLENGDAVFYDLFLDVVVGEDGKAKVIDTEELDEALLAGVVDQKQYELAVKAAEDVATFYNSNKELLEQKLYDYLKLFGED
jgi:predicted RNA-binding protein associated with RNAse of E/G family